MLDRAREIADDVLFPATLDVDRADRVPASHLDLLAAEGFYGVAARDDLDFPTMTAIVRALAGGCMTTTFVWIQHHGPVLALSATPGELADRFLPALAAGERRAGIGLAGARATTPLRVRRDAGGFRLDGTIPWVTGWDMIDTLYVAARDEQEVVCYLLMDAVAGPTLAIEFPGLVAVGASRTANVTLTGHHVPADHRFIYIRAK
jgi:alkylation response protein AidB-like acyl-CoA dehydrogenase